MEDEAKAMSSAETYIIVMPGLEIKREAMSDERPHA